ncbi:hypothetical protein ILUMI_12785 [Ignelater luminosus]|uniref:Uncharacterized protein n=1 Tax=Ignelater luminosus TaxID=2038154 RepID=A0A8K0CXH5_IGNLU|nr:hypothetical protein ILUMI_12785 [Ignelater luminosus]
MVDLIMKALVISLDQNHEIAFMTNKNENEHANFTAEDEIRFCHRQWSHKPFSVAKSGHCIKALKQKDLQWLTQTGNSIKMKDAWVCNDLSCTLLSVRKLQQARLQVIFRKDQALIKKY